MEEVEVEVALRRTKCHWRAPVVAVVVEAVAQMVGDIAVCLTS